MAVWVNELGGAEVDTSADNPLIGAYFTAIEPEGSAADHVVVLAFTTTGHLEAQTLAVAVRCAQFGAIPEGWRYATETFDAEEFLNAYRRMTPDERAALVQADDAAREAADSAAAEVELRRRQTNPTFTLPAPKAK